MKKRINGEGILNFYFLEKISLEKLILVLKEKIILWRDVICFLIELKNQNVVCRPFFFLIFLLLLHIRV